MGQPKPRVIAAGVYGRGWDFCNAAWMAPEWRYGSFSTGTRPAAGPITSARPLKAEVKSEFLQLQSASLLVSKSGRAVLQQDQAASRRRNSLGQARGQLRRLHPARINPAWLCAMSLSPSRKIYLLDSSCSRIAVRRTASLRSPCRGHPRLQPRGKDVDGRNKSGHDELARTQIHRTPDRFVGSGRLAGLLGDLFTRIPALQRIENNEWPGHWRKNGAPRLLPGHKQTRPGYCAGSLGDHNLIGDVFS